MHSYYIYWIKHLETHLSTEFSAFSNFTHELICTCCFVSGPDVVVWNLHRRYGKHRLPKLLQGWFQEKTYGWNGELIDKAAPYTLQYEPVFVLKPLQSPQNV